MDYTQLDKLEKSVFNRIEDIFIVTPALTRKSFVKVLGVLINKYKYKRKK